MFKKICAFIAITHSALVQAAVAKISLEGLIRPLEIKVNQAGDFSVVNYPSDIVSRIRINKIGATPFGDELNEDFCFQVRSRANLGIGPFSPPILKDQAIGSVRRDTLVEFEVELFPFSNTQKFKAEVLRQLNRQGYRINSVNFLNPLIFRSLDQIALQLDHDATSNIIGDIDLLSSNLKVISSFTAASLGSMKFSTSSLDLVCDFYQDKAVLNLEVQVSIVEPSPPNSQLIEKADIIATTISQRYSSNLDKNFESALVVRDLTKLLLENQLTLNDSEFLEVARLFINNENNHLNNVNGYELAILLNRGTDNGMAHVLRVNAN